MGNRKAGGDCPHWISMGSKSGSRLRICLLHKGFFRIYRGYRAAVGSDAASKSIWKSLRNTAGSLSATAPLSGSAVHMLREVWMKRLWLTAVIGLMLISMGGCVDWYYAGRTSLETFTEDHVRQPLRDGYPYAYGGADSESRPADQDRVSD